MKIEEIKKQLSNRKDRGTYQKAITGYALELLDNIAENYRTTPEDLEHLERLPIEELKKRALNGADTWGVYSWGGCSLVCDDDIKSNLFCKSFCEKHKNADTFKGFHLLDLQAFALAKGFARLVECLKK